MSMQPQECHGQLRTQVGGAWGGNSGKAWRMTAPIGTLTACMGWDFTAYSGVLPQEGLQELQGHRVQCRAALSLPQHNRTSLPAAPLQSQGRHYMWWAAAAQHPGLAHGCSCAYLLGFPNAFQRSSGCSLSIAALSKWRRNTGCN